MSRVFPALMLVISVLFAAAGIVMVATGAKGGWPALLFFGMCAVVFVGQLWPGLMHRDAPRADDLLAKFPGPVELRMDQRKMLLLIAGAAILAGVPAWMLASEPVGTWRAILLWPCVVLTGASIPILVFLLLRGGMLRLTGEALELRHGWKNRVMPWEDLGPFAVRTVPPSFTPLVVFDDRAAASARLASANTALMGHNSALPDTFGMAHAELAAVLDAWRRQALAGATRPPKTKTVGFGR